jgi:RHS repeat-associated protein
MVGLINMNGRVYDPILGRMLSPDNYVQASNNTQSYNRYSYCWNNPLKYTDPSGDIIFTAAVLIAAPFTGGASLALLPYAVGADVGMWQGGSMANGTANPFKWDYSSGKTWGYMGAGAVIGGASAFAGAGTGAILTKTTTLTANHVLYGAITGSVSGAIGGFGMGGLSGVHKNGKWDWSSAWSGMGAGAAGGFILGGASTAAGNWIMGRNIWNGHGKYKVDPGLLSDAAKKHNPDLSDLVESEPKPRTQNGKVEIGELSIDEFNGHQLGNRTDITSSNSVSNKLMLSDSKDYMRILQHKTGKQFTWSKDGNAKYLIDGDIKYSFRGNAKGWNYGPTIDVFRNNKPIEKMRFLW